MLYREIIAVCSQIHTKHINTTCGQNIDFLNVKLVVHIVTTRPVRVNGDREVSLWSGYKENVAVRQFRLSVSFHQSRCVLDAG